jgi:hypothetical protein
MQESQSADDYAKCCTMPVLRRVMSRCITKVCDPFAESR